MYARAKAVNPFTQALINETALASLMAVISPSDRTTTFGIVRQTKSFTAQKEPHVARQEQ